ncbi:unnamed protein product [Calicophoron daubneyi]|uniref:Saposin B-type domain-containing protein n=1 Tax=Calicophoron daubneyi TaxID=300641 RepID=A0AAV2TGT6_CALDB
MNALFAVLFIVVAAQAKPIKNVNLCDPCQRTMDTVKNLILGDKPREDILQEILNFCATVPQRERCKARAKANVDDWMAMGDKFYADAACLRLKACEICEASGRSPRANP